MLPGLLGHMIGFETNRAKEHGIRHYSMVSLNPKEARNPIAVAVVDAMEPYLDHPIGVGIGEIGLDVMTGKEEEIFRRQLRMGNERKMPITIHSPHHNKRKGIERIISILEEEGVEQEKIVIDHNTEETIELSLRTRCWAGLTVYYVTKLSAERAVNMITRYGTDRIIVNDSISPLPARAGSTASRTSLQKESDGTSHCRQSHAQREDGR